MARNPWRVGPVLLAAVTVTVPVGPCTLFVIGSHGTELDAGHRVVGESDNPTEALAELTRLTPALLLLDLQLGQRSGFELLEQLVKRKLSTRVIMLTMSAQPRHVAEAMRLGAHGYVLKGSPAREVLQVGELPEPQPAPGEVRVRIRMSAVNPSDTKNRSGLRVEEMPFPIVVPHQDGAGEIDAVGEGVDPGRIGERVWVYEANLGRAFGTAAQYTTVPAHKAVWLPDDVGFDGMARRFTAPGRRFRPPRRRPRSAGRRRGRSRACAPRT